MKTAWCDLNIKDRDAEQTLVAPLVKRDALGNTINHNYQIIS